MAFTSSSTSACIALDVPVVDDAIALARAVRERPPLEFAGIAFYPGHVREPVDQQTLKLEQLQCDARRGTLPTFDRAGLHPTAVSGGSTPTLWRTHELIGVTEFRPGTYVYNDRTTAAIGACDWDDCALTVLATVVSTAVAGSGRDRRRAPKRSAASRCAAPIPPTDSAACSVVPTSS